MNEQDAKGVATMNELSLELNMILTLCALYSGVVFFSLWITFAERVPVKK